MTKEELRYFEKLSEDRKDSANTLEKPSMRGVQRSVVEKYSDQAHFIYELIQNADDVGATYAKFVLYPDRLEFIHNGVRLFSVTDPDNEDADSENGSLGDINAITSIANSNKTVASIGKFGVGFKAVFQYTETPFIYDPNYSFKIERFIVPVLVDDKYVNRKNNETVFVFPFNHNKVKPEEAYKDIHGKLQKLVFPTLFLKNLKSISYVCGKENGEYSKEKIADYSEDETKCELLSLVNGNKKKTEKILLMTRTDENEYSYSVGFFVDDEYKLIPKDYYAFCFFPTKTTTNLKFIINAPFLLTDSREGIKANEAHNKEMITLLAELSADSLIMLRNIGKKVGKHILDDDMLWIIPFDEDDFEVEDEGADLSFYPFFDSIKDKLSEEELFLSDGQYISIDDAYIAVSPAITNVFSNTQLRELYDEEDAGWIFVTYGYETIYRSRDGRWDYINSIYSNGVVQDDNIIKKMTASFIEAQSKKWLLLLYEFISDTPRRVSVAKTIPIFIDNNNQAVPAFDEEMQEVLFVPRKGINGFHVINEDYMKEKAVKNLATQMELSSPSMKDEIYNIVIKKYKTNSEEIDNIEDFKKLFAYYKECPKAEIDEYLSLIKDCELFLYYDGEEQYRTQASDLYYPTDELEEYFCNSDNVGFVDIAEYHALYEKDDYEIIKEFMLDLGMKTSPQVIEIGMSYADALKYDVVWPHSSGGRAWSEFALAGSADLAEYIESEKDKGKSLLLWKKLLEYFEKAYFSRLRGEYRYYYRTPHTFTFIGECQRTLMQSEWLLDKDGVWRKPQEMSIDDLSNEYYVLSSSVNRLYEYLGIEEKEQIETPSDLTDAQRTTFELGKMCQEAGITAEELERFINENKAEKGVDRGTSFASLDTSEPERDYDSRLVDDIDFAEEEISNTREEKVAKELVRKTKGNKKKTVEEFVEHVSRTTERNDDLAMDEDDYTHSAVDYKKKIEREKEKSGIEIAKIALLEEAQERAMNAPKYSYGWFSALLDLELLNSSDNKSQSREIHITFSRVEREEGTTRILILKYPSQGIPQMMEELSDILLTLHMGEETVNIPIEVANVKGYTLRVKVKSESALQHIQFDDITSANIDAQSPIFLLEALKKEFKSLDYEDEYDFKANLCSNIEFIFGPPGTGKTTYLAKEELLNYIREKESKILVLAPTNKAADVICQRIADYAGSKEKINEWLLRYGVVSDEKLEDMHIHVEREFNITNLRRYILVTTIARIPYDYFILPSGKRLLLNEIKWDYVFFDEASMIPLYQAIYPLSKFRPKKFVFAGDPFQIEPITAVDLWKNENIYTFVKLNSFTEPETEPYDYKVTCLTTQYRSIPSIGTIFSELTYGGVLEHYRSEDSAKCLNIDDVIELEATNIIKFPVSRYESVYKAKRLNNSSPYQVYSALFTFEFVRFLAELVNARNYGKKFSIGIVAPYKSQADLIDKLLSSVYIPRNISVQAGTIHGFQGDESDLVIAVYNPPPSISESKEMFLNRKNIINVSVSRARDYLVVVMPDNNTEKVNMLRLVKKVENLCRASGKCNIYSSKEIEELMFGQEDFIEENSFSTGHQLVNVYGKPEKRYEIRSESTAIDVQLHESNKNSFVKYSANNTGHDGAKPEKKKIIDAEQPDEEVEVLDEEFDEWSSGDEETEILPITSRIINERVRHSGFGEGTVTKLNEAQNVVYIKFDSQDAEKMFKFPGAFAAYLEAVSSELQKEILDYCEKG